MEPFPYTGARPGPSVRLGAATASALALHSMVDVERFRVLLHEERDRKLALLPTLHGAPIPEGRLEAAPWAPHCIGHAPGRA